MDTRELTAAIKSAALGAGFSAIGIAPAHPLERESTLLTEWLARGMHGMMHYMERGQDKRYDLSAIVPNAKSIVSLALNYFHPAVQPEHNKISRYAWGTDYHEIVEPMLAVLLAEIRAVVPEVQARYYVDTGPVMEKPLAERAGIGWIGKHTNVITREFGSWVFLSEIILDVELAYDTPAEDLCGTCTRCIEACPTGAITEPYVVDARKCISYLTIELKSDHPIPDEHAGELSDWLYGCDICQDVCPWNRFEQSSPDDRFAPRQENIGLTDEAILAMEQPEFSMRFRKSPIKRTKLAGLKRNVRAK